MTDKRYVRMEFWRCHLEENEGNRATLVIEQGNREHSEKFLRVSIDLRYWNISSIIQTLAQMKTKAEQNAKEVAQQFDRNLL